VYVLSSGVRLSSLYFSRAAHAPLSPVRITADTFYPQDPTFPAAMSCPRLLACCPTSPVKWRILSLLADQKLCSSRRFFFFWFFSVFFVSVLFLFVFSPPQLVEVIGDLTRFGDHRPQPKRCWFFQLEIPQYFSFLLIGSPCSV